MKIRGFRIEMGEIEARLAELSGVREAVALASEDSEGNKRIVGYIVVADGSPADIGEWRAGLKQKLPEYMVPGVFVVMNEFPVTPSGKIDRLRFPAPEQEHLNLSSENVAPRNPTEQALGKIWTEVLRVQRIGITDNFFVMGGHSLLASCACSCSRHFSCGYSNASHV